MKPRFGAACLGHCANTSVSLPCTESVSHGRLEIKIDSLCTEVNFKAFVNVWPGGTVLWMAVGEWYRVRTCRAKWIRICTTVVQAAGNSFNDPLPRDMFRGAPFFLSFLVP